jgi:elongation factor G
VPGIEETARRLGAPQSGTTAQVLKTFHTAHGGKLSLSRVIGGQISDGDILFGPNGSEARIAGLFDLMGQEPQKRDKAVAGETVALGRLDPFDTGATLSSEKGAAAQLVALDRPPAVYSFAIAAKERKDEVKLTGALAKIIEEDPSLSLEHDAETHQMVLHGQGEMHLRVALERLTAKYGVGVDSTKTQVGYLETIRKGIVQRGRHKKQSGGHGQFGDVVLDIKPLPRGSGFAFGETISGGVVPKQYIPSVEAGVRDYLRQGPLGFPVVDLSVTLTDGSYHTVDSSDMAFRAAGRLAMSEGMAQCSPVLLEPIMAVEIHVPSDATARVNGMISQRRGQILGFDAREGWQGWDTVQAHMPAAELHDLIIELRSATAGVGTYSCRFDHLAELTGKLAEQVLAGGREAA